MRRLASPGFAVQIQIDTGQQVQLFMLAWEWKLGYFQHAFLSEVHVLLWAGGRLLSYFGINNLLYTVYKYSSPVPCFSPIHKVG